LPFVVADERIDWRNIDGSRDVDRIECSQEWFSEGARNGEQAPVEREQRERLEQLASAGDQSIEREAWIVSNCSSDRTRQLSEHELARDEVGLRKEGPQCLTLRFDPNQLHERRGVGVEERHSALAADLVERATERIRVAVELEWIGKSAAAWTREPPLGDQPIEGRAWSRRWPELCHGPVSVGDEQPLATLDAAEIPAEVATQLGNADRVLHVHEGSTSGGRSSADGSPPLVRPRRLRAMSVEGSRSGELPGKVALVTGAGSGIGHAIAERFAREGAAVAINYLGHGDEAETLARDVEAAGGKAAALEADVSDSAAVEALVAQVVERFGRLDVLVNNAGIEKSQPLLEIDEASWDRTLAVDLKGPFLCLQAAARRMQDGGRGSIVNISSVHEDFPFPSYAPYAAAKGGLRMLMRNAALELAPLGIRVNNIAPGAIATPINAATLADPAKVKRLQQIVPLMRLGKPEEVAEVALFLASDRSSYVTGSTYYVDGGLVRHSEPL
jgi:glucose 1-dehydrogenase